MQNIQSPLDYISHLKDNTPDFEELNSSRFRFHPVFIYDSLSPGKSHYEKLMKSGIYFGKAKTTTSGFIAKLSGNSVNEEPTVFVSKKMVDHNRGIVEGHLFGVSLRHLTDLDFCYDNGNMMQRCRQYVELVNNKNKFINAFMYVGNEKEHEDSWGPIDTYTSGKSYYLDNKRVYWY